MPSGITGGAGGSSGITNDAPANTIPATTDGDGNLGPQTNVPLVDPGNVWEPETEVAQGYRIAETMQGELRVFEAVEAGTTGEGVFTDFAFNITPLGLTSDNDFDWRYLGIVGQVSWALSPLRPEFGVDSEGPYIAGHVPVSEADTTFRILAALGDPGNVWESDTELLEAGYRIAVTVDGALRVFEKVGGGTTGSVEPDWDILALGSDTTDGTVIWVYRGIVGQPDFSRKIFTMNSAGDADWYLDVNNGSGFRFNQAVDGVPDATAGITQMTTDSFKVSKSSTEKFEVAYAPFSATLRGAPLRLFPMAFAALPASPAEGMMAWVNNSSTAVWGETVAGGGANKVLAVYNGTNWTVCGK